MNRLTLKSYEECLALLGNRNRRKLRNNCYLTRGDDFCKVIYHNTSIVVYTKDGEVLLNNGGYRTVTTKANINRYSPVKVVQKDFDWYVILPSGTKIPWNTREIEFTTRAKYMLVTGGV